MELYTEEVTLAEPIWDAEKQKSNIKVISLKRRSKK
jgi:hypothetical protein